MADINIYGTLHAATGDGVIARAAQIKDAAIGKTQATINQELYNMGGTSVSITDETLVITSGTSSNSN